MVKLNPQAEDRIRVQQYGAAPSIDGVELVALRRFNDDGGSMSELVRFDGEGGVLGELDGFRPAQLNYSVVQPGTIKAFHLHRRQTDVWFVPPEDRILLVLADMRDGSPSEGARMRRVLGDGRSELVRIPPGVAHGCRNLGGTAARILYVTDLHFSPEPDACDEGRLPWDLFGADVWDVVRE